MTRRVQFDSKFLDSGRPWHPLSTAGGIVRCDKADEASRQQQLPVQAHFNVSSNVPDICPKKASVKTKYEDLVAEADALLHKVGNMKPAETTAHSSTEASKAVKKKMISAHNKLAVVRVRVCKFLSFKPYTCS